MMIFLIKSYLNSYKSEGSNAHNFQSDNNDATLKQYAT